MTFVIFHGSFGSPDENWFPELKERLENIGQIVLIPKFPTPDNQSLKSWLDIFADIKKKFKKNEQLCFIGHSLGCLFILHAVQKYNLFLDSAIFVNPFLEKLDKPKFDQINSTF